MDNQMLNEICSCKGIRICRICKDSKEKTNKSSMSYITIDDIVEYEMNYEIKFYVKKDKLIKKLLDYFKNQKYLLEEKNLSSIHKLFEEEMVFDDFYIKKDLFSLEEEEYILNKVYDHKWIESQSGRKKQDYGPKINYKKKKISFKNFSFPNYISLLNDKVKEIEMLKDFKVREIGNLLYCPKLESHIEPHIDHTWVWGNRIIGINLLSETKMTFNIDFHILNKDYSIELNLPIYKNSMYILKGISRYKWKHGIKSENIQDKRLVITLREFDENYYKENKDILDKYY